VPSEAEKRGEVRRGAVSLAAVAGVSPRYFRFPGGCEDAADVRLVASLGEQAVQWDVVSGDSYLHDPDAIARRVVDETRPGSIVVLHLVGAPNAPATAGALQSAIPQLRAKGLRFVRLRRLLAG
jgi:peptidoglycan/xylan/chitin deacetylase (PgdA/CDA1 family)